jgi:hypothetical protein
VTTKAVREAKAKRRELQAIVDAATAADKAARAAVAPAQKRHAAIAARQAKMLMLTEAGGTPNAEGGGISLASVGTISLAYSASAKGMNAKALAAALLSGEVKINGGRGGYGSTSYTLRGYLRRGKMIDRPRLREVDRAIKRRKAAEQALHQAWRVEAQAYIAARDAGDKPDEVAIAATVAERLVVHDKEQPVFDHELNQQAHDARRRIEDLDRHLTWLASTAEDKPAECPCYTDQAARQHAIRVRDENARLDALPTVLSECPDKSHGRHRVAIERAPLRLGPDWRAKLEEVSPGIGALLPADPQWGTAELDAPRGICRKGKEPVSYVRVKTLREELEKAAKLAARKAKPSKALDWICPNPECGELNEFTPDAQDEVECRACEVVYDSNAVKTIKHQAAA